MCVLGGHLSITSMISLMRWLWAERARMRAVMSLTRGADHRHADDGVADGFLAAGGGDERLLGGGGDAGGGIGDLDRSLVEFFDGHGDFGDGGGLLAGAGGLVGGGRGDLGGGGADAGGILLDALQGVRRQSSVWR